MNRLQGRERSPMCFIDRFPTRPCVCRVPIPAASESLLRALARCTELQTLIRRHAAIPLKVSHTGSAATLKDPCTVAEMSHEVWKCIKYEENCLQGIYTHLLNTPDGRFLSRLSGWG